MQKDNKTIIDSAINHAYSIGDKDECFIKHVGHTLAAIYVGNGYNNPCDYSTPGCTYADEYKMEKQMELWKKVEDLCGEIGLNEFRELASSNKHAFYFDDYYIDMAYNLKIINKT